MLRGSFVDRAFKGFLIGIPVGALAVVACAELPVLLGLFDPGEEAAGLLVLREVQEDLHGADAVSVEVLFEVLDVFVAVLDDPVAVDALGVGLGLVEFLDLADQHVLIVGAVEDGDLALGRDIGNDAPEEVVRERKGARRLEGGLVHAVRREAGQNGADRAVLACGVHGLEEEDHAFPFFGVEHRLKGVDLDVVLCNLRLGLLAVGAQARLVSRAFVNLEPLEAVIAVMFEGHDEHLAVSSFQNGSGRPPDGQRARRRRTPSKRTVSPYSSP